MAANPLTPHCLIRIIEFNALISPFVVQILEITRVGILRNPRLILSDGTSQLGSVLLSAAAALHQLTNALNTNDIIKIHAYTIDIMVHPTTNIRRFIFYIDEFETLHNNVARIGPQYYANINTLVPGTECISVL